MLNHVGSHLNRFIKTNESLDFVDCLPFRPLEYGQLYRDTVARLQDTLENLVKLNDTWTDYMLHGIVWFQGFNDVIDPSKAAEYGPNLINLIHDVHVDLDTPRTPFIIGELASGSSGKRQTPQLSEDTKKWCLPVYARISK